MPWDSAEAAVYGRLRAELTATGQTIGTLDLLIAAHAVALGATLVTHDRALHRAGGSAGRGGLGDGPLMESLSRPPRGTAVVTNFNCGEAFPQV